ncbi:hypothetical protein CSPX01_15526 [Colletotrichum filicis]|nr:hypothetical protein CSPX01_15526 [Colletotrichum filicis]
MDRARTQPGLPDMAQSKLGMPIIAINGVKLDLSEAPERTRRRLHASKCASIPQHSQHCEPSSSSAVHVHTTVTQFQAASRPAKAAIEQTRTRTRYLLRLPPPETPSTQETPIRGSSVPRACVWLLCAVWFIHRPLSHTMQVESKCESSVPVCCAWLPDLASLAAKSKVKTDNLGSRTDKGAAAPRSALHCTATIPRPTCSVSHRLSPESSNSEYVSQSDCLCPRRAWTEVDLPTQRTTSSLPVPSWPMIRLVARLQHLQMACSSFLLINRPPRALQTTSKGPFISGRRKERMEDLNRPRLSLVLRITLSEVEEPMYLVPRSDHSLPLCHYHLWTLLSSPPSPRQPDPSRNGRVLGSGNQIDQCSNLNTMHLHMHHTPRL